MAGILVGSEDYALEQVTEVVKDGDADHLARCLVNMPDREAAAFIAIESIEQRTGYLERVPDTGLSLEARRREEKRAQWAYENILELPGAAAAARSFFQKRCPDHRLTLKPYQQTQARRAVGAGRLGLLSTQARRNHASIGSRVGILPEALADLTGPIEDRVRRGLPESSIVPQLGGSFRGI